MNMQDIKGDRGRDGVKGSDRQGSDKALKGDNEK